MLTRGPGLARPCVGWNSEARRDIASAVDSQESARCRYVTSAEPDREDGNPPSALCAPTTWIAEATLGAISHDRRPDNEMRAVLDRLHLEYGNPARRCNRAGGEMPMEGKVACLAASSLPHERGHKNVMSARGSASYRL